MNAVMGEWMSVFESGSPVVKDIMKRKARIRSCGWNQRGMSRCSERVQCMDGDVANLDEIEGIDFCVINQDLIEYIRNTF